MAPLTAPKSGDALFASVDRVVSPSTVSVWGSQEDPGAGSGLCLIAYGSSLVAERGAVHAHVWRHRAAAAHGSGGGRGGQQAARSDVRAYPFLFFSPVNLMISQLDIAAVILV